MFWVGLAVGVMIGVMVTGLLVSIGQFITILTDNDAP